MNKYEKTGMVFIALLVVSGIFGYHSFPEAWLITGTFSLLLIESQWFLFHNGPKDKPIITSLAFILLMLFGGPMSLIISFCDWYAE